MKKNNNTIYTLKAFTLLELIVAIALMDVIAVALYSSIYTAFNAKKKSRAVMRPFQSVIPAFEYFRQDLTSAMKPDGILAGVFLGENNQGQGDLDADTLSFYTCSYQPAGDVAASNIVNIEYVLEHDPDRNKYVLKRLMTKNILSPSAVDPDEEIVGTDIVGLDLQYYNGYSWLEEWDSSVKDSQLPWAVRVTMTIYDDQHSRSSEDGFRNFSRIFLLPSANQEAGTQEGGGTQSDV